MLPYVPFFRITRIIKERGTVELSHIASTVYMHSGMLFVSN
ncbi:hypothetical protein SAMN05444128_1906 [Pontibacter indicus]|uniref:Uncharacterized protein n=1 Tax=Pontibacter indicus TaxID=1317125 RepID=A0A1R3XBV5_9BACT|nr:hypothetical protein SAMN05444128_1906 [Pontibacter indicus]